MLSRTLVLIALACSAFAQPRPADIIPGRFLIEFDGEPLAAFQRAAAKSGPERAAAVISRHRDAIRSRHAQATALLHNRGIQVRGTIEIIGNAIAVAGATEEQLRDLPGVTRVIPVRRMRSHMDRVNQIFSLDQAWEQVGGVANAGAGLKIGIIDTGIDETHQAFRDTALTAPEGYPLVSSDANLPFTSGKIIVARSYQGTVRDCEGHGTGVAMAAAGVQHRAGSRTLSGVAPKAWLGVYRASDGCEGSFPTDNVELAMEDAVKDKMDIINLSLGSWGIESLESSDFEPYVKRAIEAGVMVVSAAGNEGPDSGTISDTGSGGAISVGATNSNTRSGAGVTFGGQTVAASAGSNSSDAAAVSAKAKDIASFDQSRLGCDPYPADAGVSARVAVVSRGTCDFAIKFANASTAGAVAIVIYNNEDEADLITMVSDGATIPGLFVAKADGEKLRAALAANADLDLRVVFSGTLPDDPTGIPGYSSRGPTADLGIRPDLVATGNVRTALPTAVAGSANAYGIYSGTSFAAPIVAGAAALLKQKRPGLGVAQYHSLLANSATAIPGSVLTVGAGMLNLNTALTNNAVSSAISLSFGRFQDAASAVKEFTVTNIGTTPETFAAAIASADASQPALSQTDFTLGPGESQQLKLTFDGAQLAPGAYQGAVQVTGSNGSALRIPYWMGIRGTEPTRIANAYPISTAAPGERTYIFFRLIDDSLVPFDSGNPDVESVSGGGTVSSVQYGGSFYPGTFIAMIRLGRLPGTNVFRIKAGNLEREIRIRGTE
ncbi:MAG: S8 family serine peptidase [Bryobacterales bacterium]|nr:S8 family serine peptidase [Bryobacterales bacterium]